MTDTQSIEPAVIERVLLHGDLRQLTPAQKMSYYHAVCASVGLNPLTQPFQYLVLNGKEILYARREATEQLRKLHDVSIQITAREVTEDCYVVTARATLPSGRTDENIGVVPLGGLKGESRANAMMKAETKSKRRVTLAICGLGMLDETEVSSIPGAVVNGSVDRLTGEVHETAHAARQAVPSAPIVSPIDTQAIPSLAPPVTETELPPTAVISPAQVKRFWAIARSMHWENGQVEQLLQAWGFLTSGAITRASYDALVTILQRGPSDVMGAP